LPLLDFGEAIANLVHSHAQLCDWRTRTEDLEKLQRLLTSQLTVKNAVPSTQPFHAMYLPLSLSETLSLTRRYALRARQSVALSELSFKYRPKSKSMRLRVGYVGSNFNNHPVALALQSLFSLHNRDKIEVFCYATSVSDGSASRLQIEREAEHFADVSQLHSSDVAMLINQDNIHILVNIQGYTKGSKNEIFALKPAPIQVGFLGFFIDYLLGRTIFLFVHIVPFDLMREIDCTAGLLRDARR
jgi:protein O-GlcNAc transferase